MIEKIKSFFKVASQKIEITNQHTKKILQLCFLASVLFFLNIGAKSPALSNYINNKFVINNVDIDLSEYPELVRTRLHEDLVTDVRNYIQLVAPKSKIDAETLVTLCQKYDMNISFVLAQGILESHLGTTGRALTTNSVFGVGALDNGVTRSGCIYKHPNESIEPYLILLRDQYLGNKKQITDLIKDGGFKTLKGSRYATLSSYESRLRTYMIDVHMKSSIKMYQELMNLSDEKIIEYFSPVQLQETIEIDSTQLQTYIQNDNTRR